MIFWSHRWSIISTNHSRCMSPLAPCMRQTGEVEKAKSRKEISCSSRGTGAVVRREGKCCQVWAGLAEARQPSNLLRWWSNGVACVCGSLPLEQFLRVHHLDLILDHVMRRSCMIMVYGENKITPLLFCLYQFWHLIHDVDQVPSYVNIPYFFSEI